MGLHEVVGKFSLGFRVQGSGFGVQVEGFYRFRICPERNQPMLRAAAFVNGYTSNMRRNAGVEWAALGLKASSWATSTIQSLQMSS